MDSAHDHGFAFNEAISFMVGCETQEEIDFYWDSLSAVPEAEQCGWLKDTFGVSWQIVPSVLDELLAGGTEDQRARVTEAFLQMKKFDIAELERAYEERKPEREVGGEEDARRLVEDWRQPSAGLGAPASGARIAPEVHYSLSRKILNQIVVFHIPNLPSWARPAAPSSNGSAPAARRSASSPSPSACR